MNPIINDAVFTVPVYDTDNNITSTLYLGASDDNIVLNIYKDDVYHIDIINENTQAIDKVAFIKSDYKTWWEGPFIQSIQFIIPQLYLTHTDTCDDLNINDILSADVLITKKDLFDIISEFYGMDIFDYDLNSLYELADDKFKLEYRIEYISSPLSEIFKMKAIYRTFIEGPDSNE